VEVPEPAALTLQAGAFRDEADANRRRADITLLGYPARVVTIAGAAEGTRYRVQVGPFPDGLVVIQDDVNDIGTQNFKYIDWRDIRRALGL
jgi:cell division protein FtsN